ncbi:MAG TPA: LytTR family DNA-binding domain-containing protein [Chitinophagaceae bacterium]|jgi:hypothetical protein|nr:LytTR family DNA-binding domain-containing protein [Chitinophagaceae bacterium]
MLWIAIAVLVAAVALILDGVEATLYGTGYYFSESLLFSSVWWLIAPLLYAQYHFHRRSRSLLSGAAIVLLLVILHLLFYPALVWALSFAFYDHTFAFRQTFAFGLTEHFLKLAILYGLFTGYYIRKRQPAPVEVASPPQLPITPPPPPHFLVTEGTRQQSLAATDLIYISACPPYCHLHTADRRYLYTATLKGLAAQLEGHGFVRIHKSTLVNLARVQSYQSRQNGDYDLYLSDGSALRLSRNYAQAFKVAFKAFHHLP